MQCCICGAAAEDQTPGDFDGIRVACRHCGVYEVNGAVLDRLLRLSLPARAEALAKARHFASQGQTPQIDTRIL
jgi:hypothetical protein